MGGRRQQQEKSAARLCLTSVMATVKCLIELTLWKWIWMDPGITHSFDGGCKCE